LNKSSKYTTRSTSQGVVYSFPDPEKVYRRRINRLAPRILLEIIREEALNDIQFLFQTNNQPTVNNPTTNPNVTMTTILSPLSFATIQDSPHTVPDKSIDRFPIFHGNNAISANSHISSFNRCVLKYCGGHDVKDVKRTLFAFSLEGSVVEWFEYFPANKFSTLNLVLDEFRKRWGDSKEHIFQLGALTTSHKKETETVLELKNKFDSVVKGLHQYVKPPDAAILIYYIEDFEGEMRYALRDKDPQTLPVAREIGIKIEKNMLEARKSNVPSFNRGSPSKVNDENKKKEEGQGSSSNDIKEFTQLIKEMEVSHTNQINALQNRLITMERSNSNRKQHKPNEKWPRRPPQNDQRPPNPFESTNLVEHHSIPYCRLCGEFHEESTCLFYLEECENKYGNQGNEQVNMCNERYYGAMYDWMDVNDYGSSGNFMNGNIDKATENYGHKPNPQQVVEMAKYRGTTYQRDGNKSQYKGQTSVPKVSPTHPKSNVPINAYLNIDLGGWLSNAKMLVPVLELMKIPS
jgi:hypothetical protein